VPLKLQSQSEKNKIARFKRLCVFGGTGLGGVVKSAGEKRD
jgi:hypothetical protein